MYFLFVLPFTELKAATETSVISQGTNFTDICQISSVVLKKKQTIK